MSPKSLKGRKSGPFPQVGLRVSFRVYKLVGSESVFPFFKKYTYEYKRNKPGSERSL